MRRRPRPSGMPSRCRREDATDVEWLRARSAERDATYREVATITLDTDGVDPRVIAERICVGLGISVRPLVPPRRSG